ncbi:hypothetical protein CHH69_17405 [Terribacillus saccharophilus]|uniref:hypothetical protein n=1 Tax=Terribacillus saccharophilus TaxID=361277 RepID=UPI000BA63639|nr:hypothetical protein [Terribacillus saccharophilus]PAF34127.1 hypothetical protein CHH69_17405 [Terribacillus saccharophilus]
MLAVKEKQFEQAQATYQVSRDKRDWDRAKALWNKHADNDDAGKAAVSMLAWTHGDKREVFRIKLHYAAGMINFREAMSRLRMVEGV